MAFGRRARGEKHLISYLLKKTDNTSSSQTDYYYYYYYINQRFL